jgi:hypothetical protein
LVIERRFRQRLEFQAQRMMQLAGRKEALARHGQPANELERMYDLEDVVENTPEDIKNIFKRTPNELDHARALEAGLEIYEGIDDLLNRALARRNDALRQLEWYREGLGKRLHKVSDDIIDVECTEVGTQQNNGAASPAQPAPEVTQ